MELETAHFKDFFEETLGLTLSLPEVHRGEEEEPYFGVWIGDNEDAHRLPTYIDFKDILNEAISGWGEENRQISLEWFKKYVSEIEL